MQTKKSIIIYTMILLLLSSALSINVNSQQATPPWWDKNWSYNQEIKIPIDTSNPYAKSQPIDMFINFEKPCWAKDTLKHSIRVVCWDGKQWYELESQIYDLKYSGTNYVCRCGLVFLIPDIANGNERYFVYYDDEEKPSPNYVDHVNIKDAYYYVEPISGISLEVDYYRITEDGYCVYAVGQKGQIMNRRFAQTIAKMKYGVKEFDVEMIDQGVSFYFSYFNGVKDEDEISSDQVLVSKGICVDGNLMVEFGIISESSGKDLRTTNTFKYYYSPGREKRIYVHVKHEVLKDGVVTGIVDADGTYGMLGSLKSRSARIKKMVFGDILPYLHFYGEDGNIREYRVNTNPENKEREWIISYKDDCDLGGDAWISYDEGKKGKVHAVIFSSNENIVKHGTSERDGIQLRVNTREYLSIVGTEVDYAAIGFGRNSYEKGGKHDVNIPGDLVVEFDAVFFSSDDGEYMDVAEEAKICHALAENRRGDGGFEGSENIYVLTVTPRLTGRIFSWPLLSNKFKLLPSVEVELYSDNMFVSSGNVSKPLIGAPRFKFPKLSPGVYSIKVFLNSSRGGRRFIGFDSVELNCDQYVNVFCIWEKNFRVTYHDQNGNSIKDMDLKIITGNNTVVSENITGNSGSVDFGVPYSLKKMYYLKAYYRGFLVYDKNLLMKQKNVDVNIEVYDLKTKIKDSLGMEPGVDVRPVLTSDEMIEPVEITSVELSPGEYVFEKLPCATYELQISYGGFFDKKTIKVPENLDSVGMQFTAIFNLNLELLNSRGEKIDDADKKIDIIRRGKTVITSEVSDKNFKLPPGEYTVNVFSDDKLVATKTFNLISDRKEKIVTTIESLMPAVVTLSAVVFIAVIVVFLFIKKISLNTFLKLTAMALILISLMQPWWYLFGESDNGVVSKSSEMFLVPQIMIDKVVYKNTPFLDVANIPDMFTTLLVVLLVVVCSGLIILGLSFIPNIVLKRRFSLALITSSIIFLMLVVIAFYFGMSLITELTLGSLTGEGILDVTLPNGNAVYIPSKWGLGTGFYLCIAAALTAMFAGILDFFKKEGWPKRFKK
ncbi:MAG: carboxypeptidase regulatory-like domain-containing protein [Candidatus Thermoplasmatota archaeon]|jgi:hypothetical protein|nr:carboxypeptidase regulatory-like domain-containing protein [Candidatus Thermoplasmatota archaeon]